MEFTPGPSQYPPGGCAVKKVSELDWQSAKGWGIEKVSMTITKTESVPEGAIPSLTVTVYHLLLSAVKK